MFDEMMKRTLAGQKPKSDADIRKMAYREWVDVLCQLWEAIGKPVNDKQLAVYVKQLGGVPMAILEDVVSALLREHTWNNVPTLGEIWACIRERHGEPENWIVKERPWAWRLMGEGVTAVVRELHPYYMDEQHIHTRPHRAEADRRRAHGQAYPKGVDEYREWERTNQPTNQKD